MQGSQLRSDFSSLHLGSRKMKPLVFFPCFRKRRKKTLPQSRSAEDIMHILADTQSAGPEKCSGEQQKRIWPPGTKRSVVGYKSQKSSSPPTTRGCQEPMDSLPVRWNCDGHIRRGWERCTACAFTVGCLVHKGFIHSSSSKTDH